jgi:hypothetical protein
MNTSSEGPFGFAMDLGLVRAFPRGVLIEPKSVLNAKEPLRTERGTDEPALASAPPILSQHLAEVKLNRKQVTGNRRMFPVTCFLGAI